MNRKLRSEFCVNCIFICIVLCTLLISLKDSGYDFAILTLKGNIDLNENVAIAKLPKLNEDCPPGRHLIASGWGQYKGNWKMNNELWSVAQECFDKSKCPYYKGDQERILCVGDAEEITNGPCGGDSWGTFL